jgi:hypothetical protein
MVHPNRGMLASRHAYRVIPNRFSATLLDYQGGNVCEIQDCWDSQTRRSDTPAVVSHDIETKVIKFPVLQLPEGIVPKVKYRLREKLTGKLWEIRTTGRTHAETIWNCTCVHMPEHDSED